MNKPNLMKYKDFHGSVEFSLEDSVLYGKIECINDLITYEAITVEGLNKAFKEAVDDYLETCNELEKLPNKPMSGTFNVRIGEELHKLAYISAKNNNLSLNEFVKKSIEEKLSANASKEMHVHLHIDRKQSEQAFDTDFSKLWTTDDSFDFTTTNDNERSH